MIDNARKRGVDITCDQYPYLYTGGGIANDTLPPSFRSNKSSENIVSELQQPKVQNQIKDIISINIGAFSAKGKISQ